MPILKLYLLKFDIKPTRQGLRVLALCEKEVYSMIGMENNQRASVE